MIVFLVSFKDAVTSFPKRNLALLAARSNDIRDAELTLPSRTISEIAAFERVVVFHPSVEEVENGALMRRPPLQNTDGYCQ